MRYSGGKMRQARVLAEWVSKLIRKGQDYYEPFCGALGSARLCVPAAMKGGAARAVLSDSSEPLMTMWRAVRDGWVPPAKISRKIYDRLSRTRDPRDPMTAFVGFGCSFGGRYFNPYPQAGIDDAARRARDLVMKKAQALWYPQVVFRLTDYQRVRPRNALLYLDPPYVGSAKVHSHREFDGVQFWAYARELVETGNTVMVSSFQAPKAWRSVHSWGNTVAWAAHTGGTTGRQFDERIFMHRSQI